MSRTSIEHACWIVVMHVAVLVLRLLQVPDNGQPTIRQVRPLVADAAVVTMHQLCINPQPQSWHLGAMEGEENSHTKDAFTSALSFVRKVCVRSPCNSGSLEKVERRMKSFQRPDVFHPVKQLKSEPFWALPVRIAIVTTLAVIFFC